MIPFVDIHTHHFSHHDELISLRSLDVNEYLKQNDLIDSACTLGLHPWYLQSSEIQNNLTVLESLLSNKTIYAIGECGLDKVVDVDYNLQINVFKSQILLSEKYQLPLIIHQVKAHEDIIKINREVNPSQPWIIHGMRLKWNIAKELLNAGMYLSFGHHLLNTEEHLTNTFFQTPNDKIFLETDNSTIAIDDIFVKAANIKSMDIQAMKEIVYQNFKTVFKK